MLQKRVVGNICVLIYDYVIPTMPTRSSNDNLSATDHSIITAI